MSVLLRQPHGFEGAGRVWENVPPDDPASAESPYLREPLVEWSAAALSAASFAHDDDNARSRIPELLRIEAVVAARCPSNGEKP